MKAKNWATFRKKLDGFSEKIDVFLVETGANGGAGSAEIRRFHHQSPLSLTVPSLDSPDNQTV
ncbi:MAG: hypothetical protein IJ700_06295 [Bacteroidaceae bacterium]|nr:hypothetical protein [Bacteroidaceae bacterium]